MYQIVYTLNAPSIAWSETLEEAKAFAEIMERKGYNVKLFDYSRNQGKKAEKGGKTMEKDVKLEILEVVARDLEIKGSEMATIALEGGSDLKVAYASGAGAAYLDAAARLRRTLGFIDKSGSLEEMENPVP